MYLYGNNIGLGPLPWLMNGEIFSEEAKGGFISSYRVRQVVVHLGWIDINFGHSTTCLILLGQLDGGQNGLWNWAG